METNSKLFRFRRIWYGMCNRCNNTNNTSYKSYGGKGIKCKWYTFNDFYNDMYETYTIGLTIDRINSKGNYCKENCRWLTREQNSRRHLIDSDKPKQYIKKYNKNEIEKYFKNSSLNIGCDKSNYKDYKIDTEIVLGIEICTHYGIINNKKRISYEKTGTTSRI